MTVNSQDDMARMANTTAIFIQHHLLHQNNPHLHLTGQQRVMDLSVTQGGPKCYKFGRFRHIATFCLKNTRMMADTGALTLQGMLQCHMALCQDVGVVQPLHACAVCSVRRYWGVCAHQGGVQLEEVPVPMLT